MAYKDPQEEKEYQHNYYERTKKLKGRRRSGGLGGLTRATSALGRNKKKAPVKPKKKVTVKRKPKPSPRKQAVQRKLRSIADQWGRMSKSQRKQNKSKFLKKLKNLKKKINKLYGGKSRYKVARDTSGRTYKSKGIGNVNGLSFGNVDEILESIKNTEVKTIEPKQSVSKLLKNLLKKTGTKLVNKSKSAPDLEGGRR